MALFQPFALAVWNIVCLAEALHIHLELPGASTCVCESSARVCKSIQAKKRCFLRRRTLQKEKNIHLHKLHKIVEMKLKTIKNPLKPSQRPQGTFGHHSSGLSAHSSRRWFAFFWRKERKSTGEDPQMAGFRG